MNLDVNCGGGGDVYLWMCMMVFRLAVQGVMFAMHNLWGGVGSWSSFGLCVVAAMELLHSLGELVLGLIR